MQIVHMQPLVSSLCKSELQILQSNDTRGCICTICIMDLLVMGGMCSKHVEDFN